MKFCCAWLTQPEEHMTPDFRAMSASPMLSVEIIYK